MLLCRFRNYIDAFNDASFIHAFWYTALYAIVSLFIINVLAFLIAYLLTLGIKGANLFRTAFLCLTYRWYCSWLYLEYDFQWRFRKN